MNSNYKAFYHLLKKRKSYRLLVLSNMVSQLGDWLSYIAVSLIAVKSGEDGDPTKVGLAIAGVYLAHSLPHAFAAPIIGPLVDRFARKGLMQISYLSAGLITLIIWSQIEYKNLFVLQGLICLRVLLSDLGMNARQAALPTLVTQDEIYLANALNSSIWSTLFTLGVALGGVLSTYLGPKQAIFFDTFTFFISAAIVSFLPVFKPNDPVGVYAYSPTTKEDKCEGSTTNAFPSHKKDKLLEDQIVKQKNDSIQEQETAKPKLSEAWYFVKKQPLLWVPLFAKSPVAFFNGAGWLMINVIALKRFPEYSGLAIGLLTAARGLGMGIGPALLNAKHTSLSPLWAQWLVLCSLISFLWIDQLWLASIALFFWGVGNGVNWVLSTSTLQVLTPQTMLGRITSLDFLSFTISQSLATLMAGYLIDQSYSLGSMLTIVSFFGVIGLLILTLIEQRVSRSG